MHLSPTSSCGFDFGDWGNGQEAVLVSKFIDLAAAFAMPESAHDLHMRFADHPGLFLYHCHKLEHEDMVIMRNYYVRDANPPCA
jgi:hypothetical protein